MTFPVRLSIVPSPQLTIILVMMPSASLALIVIVIGVPVGELVVDSVKLTTGGLSAMVRFVTSLVVVSPELSVAFT